MPWEVVPLLLDERGVYGGFFLFGVRVEGNGGGGDLPWVMQLGQKGHVTALSVSQSDGLCDQLCFGRSVAETTRHSG